MLILPVLLGLFFVNLACLADELHLTVIDWLIDCVMVFASHSTQKWVISETFFPASLLA